MWHRSDGVRVMNALLDSGVVPDGVVALNDMLASGVMHAIQMHNLRIPEDISVIGFDNSDDSQYLSPALTSIAPGLEAVARLSVKLLKDRIDGVSPSKDLKPEQKVFRKVSSSLVVRQSTKLPTNSWWCDLPSFFFFFFWKKGSDWCLGACVRFFTDCRCRGFCFPFLAIVCCRVLRFDSSEESDARNTRCVPPICYNVVIVIYSTL